MKKKVLGVFAALVMSASAGAFANTALGLQGGGVVGFTPGGEFLGGGALGVTFKMSGIPVVFGGDIYIYSNGRVALGATADWWVGNPQLAGMLRFFYGLGIAGGGNALSGNFDSVYAAGRGFGGLNIFVLPTLELYLQMTLQPGAWIKLTEVHADFDFRLPVNLGFRFWF